MLDRVAMVLALGQAAQAAPPPPAYTDPQNLLVYRDERGQEKPVRTPADWRLRRAHILASLELVTGPMPPASKRVPLDVQITEEVREAAFTRRRLTFATEADDRVPAYLFLPTKTSGKLPAMLCLHQTIGIGKGEPAGVDGLDNLHYARELAERGYVTLAPDYPNFGDYACDAYARGYASATMKGIWNHARALDLLQSLPDVDGARLGCIGHSLGGHNTIFLAAFDERVKVAVSSCGFNSFRIYRGGNLTDWSHNGYMPRIASVYHADAREMPVDFTEILAAVAPRPVFVNAPLGDNDFEVEGVKVCLTAAAPVYALYQAQEQLVAVHPDCGHDFPPEARQQAYAFIDRVLRH